MTRWMVCLVLASSVALAQEGLDTYNRGLAAFNGGDFDAAIVAFDEVSQRTSDAELRGKSEFYLAQALAKRGLPVAALSYDADIVQQGKANPYALRAVEALVYLQADLNDFELVPNILNKTYSDDWSALPPEALARINYLMGVVSWRTPKLDEAKDFLAAVAPTSGVYAKAQYLLGAVLADPRLPNGARPNEAVSAFQQVLAQRDAKAELDLEKTRQLALLGLGRTYYGMQQYQLATQAYDDVPRFSAFWDQALFENGWARFQNDDLGGALGSLQALHAPQFAGAFEPESWILKATVYYFSCLYQESRAALAAFDALYQPIADQLRPLLAMDEKDYEATFRLISEQQSKVPRPVLNWIRGNERIAALDRTIRQIDSEKATVQQSQTLSRSRLAPELSGILDQTRTLLAKKAGLLVRAQLKEAAGSIKGFTNQAEIIRFEIAKAEKELAESGFDPRRALQGQKLYAPKMPAENWNHWKFEGEFWRDEIGYYQYTLKKGCPANVSEK